MSFTLSLSNGLSVRFNCLDYDNPSRFSVTVGGFLTLTAEELAAMPETFAEVYAMAKEIAAKYATEFLTVGQWLAREREGKALRYCDCFSGKGAGNLSRLS